MIREAVRVVDVVLILAFTRYFANEIQGQDLDTNTFSPRRATITFCVFALIVTPLSSRDLTSQRAVNERRLVSCHSGQLCASQRPIAL